MTKGYRAGLPLGGHHLAEDENADEFESIVAILLTLRWARLLTQLQDLDDRFVEVVEAVSGRPVGKLLAASESALADG